MNNDQWYFLLIWIFHGTKMVGGIEMKTRHGFFFLYFVQAHSQLKTTSGFLYANVRTGINAKFEV